jgi:hypothetical protein
MSANITWSVTAMNCYPTVGSETDVVFTVHWSCAGTQDTYSASVYSTCSVPAPSGSEAGMIPFASLTEAQVIAWVKDKLGEATVEAALAAQIEAQRNPVKASGMPWSTAPAA